MEWRRLFMQGTIFRVIMVEWGASFQWAQATDTHTAHVHVHYGRTCPLGTCFSQLRSALQPLLQDACFVLPLSTLQ